MGGVAITLTINDKQDIAQRFENHESFQDIAQDYQGETPITLLQAVRDEFGLKWLQGAYKPSFLQKVKNLSRDGVIVVKEAVKGNGVFATDEEVDRRLASCMACRFFNAKKETCSHGQCGCHLKKTPIIKIGKARLKHLKCPVGKW